MKLADGALRSAALDAVAGRQAAVAKVVQKSSA
jgi:hypothetical protein